MDASAVQGRCMGLRQVVYLACTDLTVGLHLQGCSSGTTFCWDAVDVVHSLERLLVAVLIMATPGRAYHSHMMSNTSPGYSVGDLRRVPWSLLPQAAAGGPTPVAARQTLHC